MRRTAVCIAVLAVAGPAPGLAEIYRWTDASGTTHYTQSLDQVPPDQRPAAREAAEAPAPSRYQTFRSRAARAAAPASSQGTLRIPFRRQGGLMLVDVRLNDLVTAPFYIDTGASGISLPASVAQQLGIRTGPDTRYVQVYTANGLTTRAVTVLDSVELGAARVEHLEATVNPTMEVGLLGGSFFNNFVYHVDAAASVITLKPNEALRAGLGPEEWRERFRRVREPLATLEAYLEGVEVTRQGRREELEARRIELRQRLEELETAANQADVPETWRE